MDAGRITSNQNIFIDPVSVLNPQSTTNNLNRYLNSLKYKIRYLIKN